MPQFEKVNCSRGAPMGRSNRGNPPDEPRTVYLFKVNLDSGGYDDGGAYWGHSRESVYCARTADGAYFATVRAVSRRDAMQRLDLDLAALIRPLTPTAAERSQSELCADYLRHLSA